MSDENLRFKREILGVAVILLLGSLTVLYPFLDALILAVATSYLLRFAHKKLDNRLENEFLSTILVISGILGFISLSLYFFINNFFDIVAGLNSFTGSLQQGVLNIIEFFQLSPAFEQNVVNVIDSLSQKANNQLVDTFAAIPALFIDLGIYMVTAIYLYKDGPKIKREIDQIIDSLPEDEEKIINSLFHSIDSIFKGVFVTQFLVALILGLVAAAGFYMISLLTSPTPLIPLWAFLIAMTALLPLIANFMVYAPIGIYYLVAGAPLKGTLILGFGVVVLQILPEILIRPYIGSRQMNEHPLIIFTGFIAGPLTLGLKGIILGPLLLILSKEFILNYTDLVSSDH